MRRGGAAVLAATAAAGCGGGGDADASGVRATAARYYAALAGGDAKGACATLTADSRVALAEYGHEVLRQPHASCETTMAFVQRQSAAHLRTLRHARVLGVTVRGDRAEVRVDGVNTPTRLERSGGRWGVVARPTGETD